MPPTTSRTPRPGRGRPAAALIAALLLAAPALSSCSSGDSDVAGSSVLRDLAYVDDGDVAHTLDVHLPAPGDAAAPVLLFVHGGAWREGDKSIVDTGDDLQVSQLRDVLLTEGYAVASTNYRLSGQATFPAPIHDVKAAVRYLRANADELGVDPDRIAIAGESAGGHLALLEALSAGDADLEGDLGATGVGSEVQAAVGFYAISDSRTKAQQLIDVGCGETGRTTTSDGAMLGAEPSTPEGAELARQASPLEHVDAGDPPTLLLHGDQDCNVPITQSENLHDALAAAGVTTTLQVVDAAHADPVFYTTPEYQQLVVDFLDDALG